MMKGDKKGRFQGPPKADPIGPEATRVKRESKGMQQRGEMILTSGFVFG